MTWYYADNGKQIGPFTEEQFSALIASGTVQPATLVWEARLPNWITLAQVPPEMSPTRDVPPAAAGMATPGTVVCSGCGGSFAPDQVIRIADSTVCPACKPTYLQKLREGLPVNTPGALRYAGFWIRFGAKIIDSLIVAVPVLVIYFLGAAMFGVSMITQQAGGQPNFNAIFASLGLQLGVQLVGILIGGLYTVLFIYKCGATPGKMALGLRVVMDDGGRLSLGRSIGRYFAEMVSGLMCYIGYILVGFDGQKRALHDHMCSTRVVYK